MDYSPFLCYLISRQVGKIPRPHRSPTALRRSISFRIPYSKVLPMLAAPDQTPSIAYGSRQPAGDPASMPPSHNPHSNNPQSSIFNLQSIIAYDLLHGQPSIQSRGGASYQPML